MTRKAELQKNLTEVENRIAKACQAARRPRESVTLIAVTKTWPASDIQLLHELGMRNFGESKDQEASQKVAELSKLDINWHFIGQLQTNKLNHIARYANVVHAIDRAKVVAGLDTAAQKSAREIVGLVQVSIDGDESRGGIAPAGVLELANLVTAAQNLRLGGVMAVAPLGMDPDLAFAKLLEISKALQKVHPQATTISAGMSSDLEAAIKNGATHLRIGSDLLGKRA